MYYVANILPCVAEKIFADSSFYDEPQHKYPTIEEQIKMARRVAQSLTAPGNVKARGQRMFLHRKEKADHWTADALAPRVRRAAVARAAAAAAAAEQSESESELPYYNPAPWSTRSPAPWVQAGGGPAAVNPSWTTVMETSPSWQPVRHVNATMPRHSGNVPPPQVAFGLAKDLTRTHDKGGRMFAKLRARAAVEETEDYTSEAVQAARGDVMRRIVDSYVPPAQPAPRYDVVDNNLEHQQPASATRLVEMIEKSRATTGDPFAKHPASGQQLCTWDTSWSWLYRFQNKLQNCFCQNFVKFPPTLIFY